MNLLSLIYIILYICYIILGPHFIRRIINKDKLLIVNNSKQLLKRIFYLSYLSLLYNAYYFSNPSLETFYNVVLINTIVIIGFIIKWHYLKNIDPYYLSGIISHILLSIPIFISPFFLDLSGKYKIGCQTIFNLLFLFIYGFIINIIYLK